VTAWLTVDSSIARNERRGVKREGGCTPRGERRRARESGEARDTHRVAARERVSCDAQRIPVLRRRAVATSWKQRQSFLRSAPRRELQGKHSFEKSDFKSPLGHGTGRLSSPTVSSFVRRGAEIGKNIIGRSVPVLPARFRRGGGLFAASRAFMTLDQPARQHRGRVFFDPTIQQLTDFFTQIGRVAQPRKFVTLQGATGGGEEKLPRGLGAIAGHGVLQGSEGDSNSTVITVNSTSRVSFCGKLWKSLGWRARPICGETQAVPT
jgi:hypothetical protein